jgi:hypothetical protein
VNIGLLLAFCAATHPSEPAPVPRAEPESDTRAMRPIRIDPPAFDPPDPKWLARDFGSPRTDRRAKRDRSGRVGRRDYARGRFA